MPRYLFLLWIDVSSKVFAIFLLAGCATASISNPSVERRNIEASNAHTPDSPLSPHDTAGGAPQDNYQATSSLSALPSAAGRQSDRLEKTDNVLDVTPKSETLSEEEWSEEKKLPDAPDAPDADDANGGDDANDVVWETDFEQAKRKSAKTHKNIFMLVTAISWCLPCQLLDQHVFEKTRFLKDMSEKYILFVLDFSKVPDDEAAQERAEALVAKYELTTLPEMLLIDNTGVVFGRFEFEGTKAETYYQIVNQFEQRKEETR